MKSKEVDILHGPLFSSIIRYCLPVMFGSLIQTLFNAADMVVLGQMAGEQAVAAVGATSAIVGLLVISFVAMSNGTSILLARYLGNGDMANTRRTVDTSVITSVVLGLVLAVIGIVMAGQMLIWTECPASCFADSRDYLILYFAGLPAIMLYNFGSAIIRVTGDSKSPMYYLILSGLLNVVLNVILCFLMERKVLAVAIATLVSQVLGAVLVTVRITHMDGPCRMFLSKMNFDFGIMGKILRYGAPCAFNISLFALSNVQIQGVINLYDEAAIAGSAATASIEGMVNAFTGAFSVAALAFLGQNIGAGNTERVKKSVILCLCLGIVIGTVLGLSVYLLGRPLLRIYVPESPEAVEYGMIRMIYINCFYGVNACYSVLTAGQQAFGHSVVPMLISIVAIFGIRELWMFVVYPSRMTFPVLFQCYTVTWIASAVAHAISFLIIYNRYRHGHVKTI